MRGGFESLLYLLFQALNLALEGVQQFPSGKGHLYKEKVTLYRNLAKGTTAKAQGITAIAVAGRGYFEGVLFV